MPNTNDGIVESILRSISGFLGRFAIGLLIAVAGFAVGFLAARLHVHL